MDSRTLCNIAGASIVIIQLTCLLTAIFTGEQPLHYAHGFSLWGLLIAIPFLRSK